MIGMTEWSMVVMKAQDAINELGKPGAGIVIAAQHGGETVLRAAAEEPILVYVAKKMLETALQATENQAAAARYEKALAALQAKVP